MKLGFSIILVTNILAACSPENEHVSPQSPNDNTEKALVLSDPIPIDPPESEVEDDISNLPFPGGSSSIARVASGGTTDFVDFNDPFSLDLIPNDAVNMNASSPFYIQQVGSAWVQVREKNYGPKVLSSNYGYYFLAYQYFNPEVDLETGNMCKPTRESCIEFDPLQEHRYLLTHSSDQWIEIRAYDYDNSYRIFDLKGMFVRSGPIKLMFRKASGQWYNYPSLAPGVYEFPYFCKDITKVLVASANGESFAFDNVEVHVPAL